MSCHFYQKKDICHVIIVMLPIRIVAAGLKGKLVTLLDYMSSAQGRLPTAIGLDSNHKQSHLLPIHNHYLPSIFYFLFFIFYFLFFFYFFYFFPCETTTAYLNTACHFKYVW